MTFWCLSYPFSLRNSLVLQNTKHLFAVLFGTAFNHNRTKYDGIREGAAKS